MNKGLFIHLMVTGLIIIMWLFVMWDEPISRDERACLVGMIILSNVFTLFVVTPDEPKDRITSPYNQKIKL